MVGGISTFFICTRSTLTPPQLGDRVDLHALGDRVLRFEDVVERVLAQ
jgi:hypothetical protein